MTLNTQRSIFLCVPSAGTKACITLLSFSKTGSQYVAQIGLELVIFLLQAWVTISSPWKSCHKTKCLNVRLWPCIFPNRKSVPEKGIRVWYNTFLTHALDLHMGLPWCFSAIYQCIFETILDKDWVLPWTLMYWKQGVWARHWVQREPRFQGW